MQFPAHDKGHRLSPVSKTLPGPSVSIFLVIAACMGEFLEEKPQPEASLHAHPDFGGAGGGSGEVAAIPVVEAEHVSGDVLVVHCKQREGNS